MAPDILLIDEVLGRWRSSFSKPVNERIIEMVRSNATVVMVTHSRWDWSIDLCDRTLCMASLRSGWTPVTPARRLRCIGPMCEVNQMLRRWLAERPSFGIHRRSTPHYEGSLSHRFSGLWISNPCRKCFEGDSGWITMGHLRSSRAPWSICIGNAEDEWTPGTLCSPDDRRCPTRARHHVGVRVIGKESGSKDGTNPHHVPESGESAFGVLSVVGLHAEEPLETGDGTHPPDSDEWSAALSTRRCRSCSMALRVGIGHPSR